MSPSPRRFQAHGLAPGGSEGGSPSALETLAGAWTGTCAQSSRNGLVYALFLPDGTFRVMYQQVFTSAGPGGGAVTSWVQAAGAVHLQDGTLSGSGRLYHPPLLANPNLPLCAEACFGGFASERAMALTLWPVSSAASGQGTEAVTLNLAPFSGANVSVPLSSLAGNYVAEPSGTSSTLLSVFTLPPMPTGAATASFGGVDAVARISGGLIRAIAAGPASGFSHASQLHFTVTPPAIFNGSGPFAYGGLAFAVPGVGIRPKVLVIMANAGPIGFAGVFTAGPDPDASTGASSDAQAPVPIAGLWAAPAGSAHPARLAVTGDGSFRLLAQGGAPDGPARLRAKGLVRTENGLVLGGGAAYVGDSGSDPVPVTIQGTLGPGGLSLVAFTDHCSRNLALVPVSDHLTASALAEWGGSWWTA